MPHTLLQVQEQFTQKDFHCVWEDIMWEERREDVLGYLWAGRGGDVKIWFGLRPEQGICLDVTHKGDCVCNQVPVCFHCTS